MLPDCYIFFKQKAKINNEYVCDKYFYYDEKQWKLVSSEKINNKENLDINLFIYEK